VHRRVSGTVPSGKDPHGRCDARNLSEDLGLVEDVPKSPTAEHRDPKTTKPYDRCGYNPERGADSSRCDLLENRYWAPLMARNASIYISSDAVARSTVYRGDPALPFSPREAAPLTLRRSSARTTHRTAVSPEQSDAGPTPCVSSTQSLRPLSASCLCRSWT
jgi:hypothetical protein